MLIYREMTKIKHIEIPVTEWGWTDFDKCPCKNKYAHYLWKAAPEIDWYYVEDVGSYQGTVYAVGKYQKQWFVMKDYYGSCSVCGAWGEGGEPEDLKGVLSNGELFSTKKEALKFAVKTYKDSYESPTEIFWDILLK